MSTPSRIGASPETMKQSKQKPFGYHLMLDLYDCDPKHLEDIQYTYHLLDTIVAKIKMEKQSPPSLFLSDSKRYPDKAGISGWVPLIESGLMIHTLVHTRAVFIDLFSCRKFPVDTVQRFFEEAFGAHTSDIHFVERGKRYYSLSRAS